MNVNYEMTLLFVLNYVNIYRLYKLKFIVYRLNRGRSSKDCFLLYMMEYKSLKPF